MNWTEFISACDYFLALSEQYGDSWSAEGDPTKPGEYFIFLRTLREYKSQVDDDDDDGDDDNEKVPDEEEGASSSSRVLLSCRFDVIFSLSYSVPVMYFKMSKSDGSCLGIQEIWELVKVSSPDLWSTVSQMDHPVLQVPFYSFHACQTEKLMESLSSPSSSSSSAETNNRTVDKLLQPHEFLISWLSFMASILQFNFSQQYIVKCSKQR